mmetsp:Transcript_6323/g.17613  ORF Transcript_6323/g.17613 Transcript_6323/m.17613 type:complete len:93 (+) Transcript_6323:92-370(+)
MRVISAQNEDTEGCVDSANEKRHRVVYAKRSASRSAGQELRLPEDCEAKSGDISAFDDVGAGSADCAADGSACRSCSCTIAVSEELAAPTNV